jgi:hypothetical protein
MPPAFGESAESRRIIVVDLIEIFRRDPLRRDCAKISREINFLPIKVR